MNKQELLKQEFGNFSDYSRGCYYFSDGKWSLHDLLEYLLSITGKSVVLISSYSIGEASVREFLRLKESGQITTLKCMLDFSVKSQKSGLLFFASNVADEIRLAANHSKLILIMGVDIQFTVITSANFTDNPRYETGVINSNPQLYKFYETKFLDAFKEATPVNYD